MLENKLLDYRGINVKLTKKLIKINDFNLNFEHIEPLIVTTFGNLIKNQNGCKKIVDLCFSQYIQKIKIVITISL